MNLQNFHLFIINPNKVYIGRISKKENRLLLNNKDVTSEFLCCAIQRWNNQEEIITETDENGKTKKYKIICQEIK